MRLLRYVRRYGLRDGWFLWSQQRQIAAREALAARRPPFRLHHGEKPRFSGYRRRV